MTIDRARRDTATVFELRGKIAFYLYLIVHAHEPVTDRKTSMRNPVLKLVDGLTLVLAALTQVAVVAVAQTLAPGSTPSVAAPTASLELGKIFTYFMYRLAPEERVSPTSTRWRCARRAASARL
jgi:hypothetical protein